MIAKRFKLVGKIYFDDGDGETKVVWTNKLDKLKYYPTSHLDLASDILDEIEDRFDGDYLIKQYGRKTNGNKSKKSSSWKVWTIYPR